MSALYADQSIPGWEANYPREDLEAVRMHLNADADEAWRRVSMKGEVFCHTYIRACIRKFMTIAIATLPPVQ